MPSAQITTYSAYVGRLGELGDDRMLVLSHVMVADGAQVEATSEVFFSDRFGRSAPGFVTVGAADRVRAHLPGDDYAVWLDLLRHEAPVFLHWTIAEAAGEPDRDGIIHLATGPEPPGEGPVDLSH
ncbi:MAG: hypothetical protein AAF567_24750 [Actinomycetota bacterium]